MAAKSLNENELDGLHKGCAKTNFTPGEMIIKQDALSTNVVYLKSGVVKVHFASASREKIIRIHKAPIYLGLPSTFGDKVNQFSVTALDNCNVCFLDLEGFKRLIFENGEFAYKIIVDMSRNELNNFHNCLSNAQKQTTGRIADAILFFSRMIYERSEFIFPLTRHDLGNLAGTTRENASRILTQFHNDKIIQISGKRVSILNEKLLQQISEKG